MGDVLPTFLPLLAEAVTGGSTETHIAKLDDMMKKGQVYTSKYLPLVFELLDRESKKLLPEYYKTIRYQRGQAATQRENYIKSMMDSGGERGVANFWATLADVTERVLPSAKMWGNITERGSHLVSAAMLVGPEFMEYLKGQAGEGNFMTMLFGKNTGEFTGELRKTIEELANLNKALGPLWEALGKFTVKLLEASADAATGLVKFTGELASNLTSAIKGDWSFVQKGIQSVGGRVQDQLGSNPRLATRSEISNWILKWWTHEDKIPAPSWESAGRIPSSAPSWAGGPSITNIVNANIDASGQPTEVAQKVKEAIETIVIDTSSLQYSQTQNGFPKVSQ